MQETNTLYFDDLFNEPLNESLRHAINHLLSKVNIDRINIYTYNKGKNILQSQIVYFNNKILLGDEEIYINSSVSDSKTMAIKSKEEILTDYELIFPLFDGTRLYGLTSIDRTISKKKFSQSELDIIKNTIFFISISIKNHMNLVERESRIKQLNAILKINNLFITDYKLDKILRLTLKYLYQYGHFDRVRLYQKEDDHYILSYNAGIINLRRKHNETFYLENLLKQNIQGIYYNIPLKVDEEEPYGFIEVDNIISQIPIEKSQLDFLKIVASQLSLFLKNYMLVEKLRVLSNTDPLTGAFNYRFFRKALEAEIEKSKRYKYPVSILFIDINDFKNINDTCGHLKGDEVLIKVVKTLNKIIRKSDILCRYGGDEFVIILPYINKKGAMQLKKRITDNFPTVPFKNRTLKKITYSIGISVYPTDSKNIDTLLKKADMALYTDKALLKNNTYSK